MLTPPRNRPASPLEDPALAGLPRYVEPLEGRVLFSSATPDDPLYASQYALADAQVAGAWATTTGDADAIVADLDTGADYTHEDLYANVWINQAEIPEDVLERVVDADADGLITFYDLNDAANAGVTTDVNANGYIDAGDLLNSRAAGGWEDGVNGQSNADDVYVDDLVGWDFAENDNDPYDDGTANGGHGTHTAGVIGATGDNGVGVSGVSQVVSLMLVRVFDDLGAAIDDATLAAAIRYSADSGALVANASWGGGYGYDGDAVYQAIAYAGTLGQVFVVAAGNDGANLDSWWFDTWPAEYALDNIIVVGATDEDGNRAYYSNYGTTTVDVFAPGSDVLSTLPGNQYGTMSGTSMATPLVTGAVALMRAANPDLTAAQIKQQLIDGADESAALNSRSVSGGAVNVANAMLAVAGADYEPTPVSGGGGFTGWFFGRPVWVIDAGSGAVFVGGSPFSDGGRIGASDFFG